VCVCVGSYLAFVRGLSFVFFQVAIQVVLFPNWGPLQSIFGLNLSLPTRVFYFGVIVAVLCGSMIVLVLVRTRPCLLEQQQPHLFVGRAGNATVAPRFRASIVAAIVLDLLC
jgi:hypothetical protein